MKSKGYIDLQVNGYKGIDFTSPDLSLDEIIFVTRELAEQGTTGYLPTLITSPINVYERNLPILVQAMKRDKVRDHILGIHLEGPFISDEIGARGAHNPSWIIPPEISVFERLMKLAQSQIKILTIAAELKNADKLCQHATRFGVIVSLGHQNASGKDMERLVKAGAKSLTHLGNGIPFEIHRHNNPIFSGMANDSLMAMIITDGHHLPPPVIKSIVRAKGSKNIILVSDASPVAGLQPGKYKSLGNDVILNMDGRLYNSGTGFLVGSSSTMKQCVEFIRSMDILSETEILDAGFLNPLKLIGISPKEL